MKNRRKWVLFSGICVAAVMAVQILSIQISTGSDDMPTVRFGFLLVAASFVLASILGFLSKNPKIGGRIAGELYLLGGLIGCFFYWIFTTGVIKTPVYEAFFYLFLWSILEILFGIAFFIRSFHVGK